LANGGTLLLDEISEVSPRLQAKLLRVLQEREFERVGGTKTIKVDVRVLATTNRDLRKAVAAGDFREDLYYRLNVFPVFVPPLRERDADVRIIAETFLARFARKHGVKIPGFSQQAINQLFSHTWPGNVRELQNTIERAVILTEPDTPVQAAALGLGPLLGGSVAVSAGQGVPAPVRAPIAEPAAEEPAVHAPDGAEVKALHEVEKEHILRALSKTSGNRTKTAELLGISIRTLRNKLNEYQLAESGE
jgi:transcriptional regulator with PAS, ATPase and Fis domain